MSESSLSKGLGEKYWLLSLIVLIAVIGILIVYSLWAYLSGLLGACTLYVVIRDQMTWLTEKKKVGNKLAATLLLLEVTFCFLIPVFLMVLLFINKLENTTIDFTVLVDNIGQYLQAIKEKTGVDLMSSGTIESASKVTGTILQSLLNGITNFVINALLLIFVLYFLLVSRKEIEAYTRDLLPFKSKNKVKMLQETKIIINSNALGIPLIALIQGGCAFLGYWIFGVNDPLLFALFTGIASIIPLLGTGIVWLPLCIYLFLTRDWGNAIGLAVYCVLIVTNVDSVARMILQKKMGDIHPLITVFGVIIGLCLFGFWGIIFGPLILSLFCLFVDIYKKEYIDKNRNNDSGIERIG